MASNQALGEHKRVDSAKNLQNSTACFFNAELGLNSYCKANAFF
jgi:hypothetical protein